MLLARRYAYEFNFPLTHRIPVPLAISISAMALTGPDFHFYLFFCLPYKC